jgi:hypothetical protein
MLPPSSVNPSETMVTEPRVLPPVWVNAPRLVRVDVPSIVPPVRVTDSWVTGAFTVVVPELTIRGPKVAAFTEADGLAAAAITAQARHV